MEHEHREAAGAGGEVNRIPLVNDAYRDAFRCKTHAFHAFRKIKEIKKSLSFLRLRNARNACVSQRNAERHARFPNGMHGYVGAVGDTLETA